MQINNCYISEEFETMKVLIFVILSIVFVNCFGQSQNNTVNSSVNLKVDVSVINDSISKIREDFETYKRMIKLEYDNKVDAVNQENDGRYQVLGFCLTGFVTLIILFLGFARLDTKEKIESGIVLAFDGKFEKDKKKIEQIRDEASEILTQIKEIQASALLEKGKINIKTQAKISDAK